jgi:hypothetical protein
LQPIIARWNIPELKGVVRIGDGIKRCGEAHNDRTHLRVDIAEDVRDAFARKRNRLAGSGLIKPKLKAFALEEGEDVMEEGIGVGKLNHATNWNDLQMGEEGAIFLQERVMALRREGKRGSACKWFKPSYRGDSATLVLLR